MKLIKSKVELIKQEPGLEGLGKHIEKCGRVAYQSYDKITENSYEAFVSMIKERNHGGVLEHGTVYLFINKIDYIASEGRDFDYKRYDSNPYSIVNIDSKGNYYITTNFRVLFENDWLNDLKYQVDTPTRYHEKRISIKFICSIGIGREILRHRVFSMIQESTRYCTYSNDKFDNQLTFIIPEWCKELPSGEYALLNSGKWIYTDIDSDRVDKFTFKDDEKINGFLHSLLAADNAYRSLISDGCIAQQAREVLPLATKTEIVMTGTVNDWKHFLSLRSPAYGAKGVHPDCAKLADNIYDILISEGYLFVLEDEYVCDDSRLEIIEAAKKDLLKSTNIEAAEDEMKVLSSTLFRCWQMGWLDKYKK